MDFVTPEEMREAERRASSYGLDEGTLMENAGAAVALIVKERYSRSRPHRLLVVCGLGNNGGDGLVAARQMGDDWRVRVILLGHAGSIRTEAAAGNWRRLRPPVEMAEVPDEHSLRDYDAWFAWASIILDSVLGTGVRGEVREPLAGAIRMINASGATRVAVDLPSGLDPFSGEAASATVEADLTVALHRAKVGLRGKGEYTGELVVVPIGITE
jgi:hydroxyethylthiazole kinase-like uncharacterized protein yjeF